MFSLKKIGAAVAFAVATAFAASSANAALISITPDDPTRHTLTLGDFFQTGDVTLGSNEAFTDTFLFHLPDHTEPLGSQPVFYGFDVTFANPATSIQGIRNLTFTITDETNGGILNIVVITDNDGFALGDVSGGEFNFVASWPAPIDLRVDVSGTALENGGSYSKTISAVEVPLPASVLMLVGALAGLGFVGRVKRSRFAAA